MSSIYYKRWTRMHFFPALKNFHKWNVINKEFDIFKPIIYSNQFDQGLVKWQPKWKGKTPSLDKKLLDKLFSKYPDLKYEKLNMDTKVDAEKDNMFSFAYKFLRKQKNLISQGFSESKAFEMVEKDFQVPMQRKLNQTLLARGLAIGNRARSLLTTYQQQMEYESKLKMLRTKREVTKYEEKIKKIREKLDSEQDILDEYKRVLYTIPPIERDETAKEILGMAERQQPEGQMRMGYINEFADRVNNMFKVYYSRASSKDKLNGLTDDEIKRQIMIGPSKVRKQLQDLLRIAKKYNIRLGSNGELVFTGNQTPRITKLFKDNASLRIALMLQDLEYEQPHRIELRRELRERKANLQKKDDKLTEQERQTILKNKKAVYKEIQPYDLREGFQTYKAFETYEQRLLRIEIKWLQSKISSLYNDSETDADSIIQNNDRLSQLVDKFRRLKFRMDQKVKSITTENIDEAFQEHKLFEDNISFANNVDYQALFHYLKVKHEERRMTPADALTDDKIHSLISNIKIDEDPIPEGWTIPKVNLK